MPGGRSLVQTRRAQQVSKPHSGETGGDVLCKCGAHRALLFVLSIPWGAAPSRVPNPPMVMHGTAHIVDKRRASGHHLGRCRPRARPRVPGVSQPVLEAQEVPNQSKAFHASFPTVPGVSRNRWVSMSEGLL